MMVREMKKTLLLMMALLMTVVVVVVAAAAAVAIAVVGGTPRLLQLQLQRLQEMMKNIEMMRLEGS